MFNPQIFFLSIFLNALGSALLTAVLFIVIWSSWKERVNRLLAMYLFVCLIWSVSALTGRIVLTSSQFGYTGEAPFFLVFFVISSIAGNSPFLLAFVIDYIGRWEDKQLKIARWIAFLSNGFMIVILWFSPSFIINEYGVTPNGMITVEPTDIALPIVGACYFIWYGVAIYLLYRHAWPRGKPVVLGAILMASGLAIEIVSPLADLLPIALVVSGISAVTYGYAIVQDEIFNPLRQKNEQLNRSRQNLEETLSAIPGSVIVTRPNGKILWVNAESATMLNCMPTDLIDDNITNYYPNTKERAGLLHELEQTGIIRNIEMQYRPNNQDLRWGRLDVVQTEFEGTPAQLGIMQDIHEQRQAQEALQAMQKWESLAVLAGGIAHDFNNLLVAMMGQASLARYKMGADNPGYKHIVKVEKAAERAALLTNQMLAYSGRGQFEIRQIDMNTLISDNLHLFEASIPKNVSLQTSFHQPLPLIEADTAQMQQVIMNLIINASQAINNNVGRIEVSTGLTTLTEQQTEGWHFTGETLMPGDYICINAKDNGCGIEESKLASIFDPFYSTKETGSGLGLAAVLGIVRGHRGGIQVTSTIGVGTQFSLLLPTTETPTEQPQTEVAAASIENVDSKTVLVIDDETSVTEVVRDMLSAENIPTFITNCGEEGIDIYRKNQDAIGLVLLDLSMPNMNGEQVFKSLREINPAVKVILSSGYSQIEATRHFVGRDLAGFMQKPYDLNTMLKTIRPYFS